MPATINGGGDQLARGAVRAQFKGPKVSQERWDSIFGADSGPKPNISSDSDSKPSGTTGVKPRKTRRSAK